MQQFMDLSKYCPTRNRCSRHMLDLLWQMFPDGLPGLTPIAFLQSLAASTYPNTCCADVRGGLLWIHQGSQAPWLLVSNVAWSPQHLGIRPSCNIAPRRSMFARGPSGSAWNLTPCELGRTRSNASILTEGGGAWLPPQECHTSNKETFPYSTGRAQKKTRNNETSDTFSFLSFV